MAHDIFLVGKMEKFFPTLSELNQKFYLGELIKHFATSHTAPNFSCTRCNIKFVQESELLAHSDHCVEPLSTLFICDFCPKIFPENCHIEQRYEHLRQHMLQLKKN